MSHFPTEVNTLKRLPSGTAADIAALPAALPAALLDRAFKGEM